MGAIAISEPIFTKIGVLASKLVSVGFAKIDAITAIWWSINPKSDEDIYGSYIQI